MSTIGIRADANSIVASGHVMRCVTIARQIVRLGYEVTFFVADEESAGLAGDYMADIDGVEIVVLGSDWQNMEGELPVLAKELTEREIRVLLVDSYKVTKGYFKKLSEVCRVAYMDDLGKEAYPVDLLINYSGYYEEIGYDRLYSGTVTGSGEAVKMLLGLKYAPLREQFYRESSEEDIDAEAGEGESFAQCGNKSRQDSSDSSIAEANVQTEHIVAKDKETGHSVDMTTDRGADITTGSMNSYRILLTAGGADMHGMLTGILEEMDQRGMIDESPENAAGSCGSDGDNETCTEVKMCESGDICEPGKCIEPKAIETAEVTGEESRQIFLDVIVGRLTKNKEEIRSFAEKKINVQIHENVKNMAELMRCCDVAVAAAGTMLTECAAVGLPAIYYQVADNQKFNVEFWQKTGGMIFAGDVSSGDDKDRHKVISEICEEIEKLTSEGDALLYMKKTLKYVTDGRGAIRIAQELVKL